MKKLPAKLLTLLIGVVVLTGLLIANVPDVKAAQSSAVAIIAQVEVSETEGIAEPSAVTAEPEVVIAEPEATTTPAIATPAPDVKAATVPDETANLLKQLETEILPQIESVLTPEQQAEFAAKVASGTSFRKAFKSVTLTPAQKNKLSTVFKAIPKKDIFATLTPAQKKELFMKNKQLFIPTSEEIGAKINAGMQMGKDKSKSPFAPSSDEIVDKISAKRKAIGIEE
jgi:hypothetical protein